MSKPASLVDQLVRTQLDAYLKPRGFSRRVRTWNRRRLEFVDVVGVQAARFNETGKAESFTINVGIMQPTVYELCWGRTAPSFAREEECVLRARIGVLVSGASAPAQDLWWKVTPESDLSTLGSHLCTLLDAHVLPLYGQINSLVELEKALSAGSGWQASSPLSRLYLVILRWQLDNAAGAEELLRSFDRKREAEWLSRVNHVVKKLGLPGRST